MTSVTTWSTSTLSGYYAVLSDGSTVTHDTDFVNLKVWCNGCDVTSEYDKQVVVTQIERWQENSLNK